EPGPKRLQHLAIRDQLIILETTRHEFYTFPFLADRWDLRGTGPGNRRPRLGSGQSEQPIPRLRGQSWESAPWDHPRREAFRLHRAMRRKPPLTRFSASSFRTGEPVAQPVGRPHFRRESLFLGCAPSTDSLSVPDRVTCPGSAWTRIDRLDLGDAGDHE